MAMINFVIRIKTVHYWFFRGIIFKIRKKCIFKRNQIPDEKIKFILNPNNVNIVNLEQTCLSYLEDCPIRGGFGTFQKRVSSIGSLRAKHCIQEIGLTESWIGSTCWIEWVFGWQQSCLYPRWIGLLV